MGYFTRLVFASLRGAGVSPHSVADLCMGQRQQLYFYL